MLGNLSPKTFRKNSEDKAHKLIVLIASADAALRPQWALSLQGAFAIHEVSERSELERRMTDSKPPFLRPHLDLPQLGRGKGVPAIQRLSPSTKVILFTSSQDEREAIKALKAG